MEEIVANVAEDLCSGSDAVLIEGCYMPFDCYYINGNFKTLRRINLLKEVLQQFWINPERSRLELISQSGGDMFAAVARDMIKQIKRLGPSQLSLKGVIAQ
jgi:F420-non-reducing hydrogenase iron-sulfur subunit